MPGIFDRLLKKEKTSEIPIQPKFTVGAVINQRYRLDAEIGRGGMGVIYRAYDLTKNREVAFKVINPETSNSLSLEQFKREMEILSRLQHPHIVSIFETGLVNENPSLPFFVMELLAGKPLTDMGLLTYVRIVSIAKQICETLAYIHRQGFVYRDLKPGNVFIEKRGFDYFVKLVDFGLARLCDEAYLPNESSLAGTVFYLAPELIAGRPAGISSDLYALGILLYEMITGRVPFSDIDEHTIQNQHLQQHAPPPSQTRSDVPQALDAIVLRLLEKDGRDRFASAEEVNQALESVSLGRTESGNLPPVHQTGRDDEIAQVIQMLESNTLVTLLNDDEMLAVAAADKLSSRFSDGVWIVPLESAAEPGMVLPTVLSILGIGESPNRPPVISLIEHMREKNLLLLLSHCGHVLGACAQLVTTIIDVCPDVYILAISGKPLGIPVEKCLEV